MLDKDGRNSGRYKLEIIDLDTVLPKEHIIRRIDAAVDWNAVEDKLLALYSRGRGRPSVEPTVIVKIALLQHIFSISSLRGTIRALETDVAYRWFIGCPLGERVPHFSTVSVNLQNRIGSETFTSLFCEILLALAHDGCIPVEQIAHTSAYLPDLGVLFAAGLPYPADPPESLPEQLSLV